MKYHFFRVDCDEKCPDMIRQNKGIRITRMTKENLGVYQLTSLTSSTSSTTKVVPTRITKKHLFDCTKQEKLTTEQLNVCKENAPCYRKLSGHKEDSHYTTMVQSEHCDERTNQCTHSCPSYLSRKTFCCLGLKSEIPDPPVNLTDDEDFSGYFESSGEGILENETFPTIVEAQPFINCSLLLKVGLPVLTTVIVLLYVLYLWPKCRKHQPSRRMSKTSPENFDLLESTDSVTTGKTQNDTDEVFSDQLLT